MKCGKFSLLFGPMSLTFPFVVLSYGCCTWLLPLREEFRLTVLGRGVLREIFVRGRKKITGWIKLHKEQLKDFFIF